MSSSGWIGVDLDGTLAEYTTWKGPQHIGAPIPAMVERVKAWLAEGRDVRIFTARVSHSGNFNVARMIEIREAREAIYAWCREHIGRELPVTNVKDFRMTELWDDRAVAVEMNTGRQLSESTRGTWRKEV